MTKRLRYGAMITLFMILLGCQTEASQPVALNDTGKLPVLKVIADSEQALAAFRLEQKHIEEKLGVRLEFHYPQRLNDNLEDFLFASKDQFDIYVLFPAKIPQYVERGMLIPLDRYIQKNPAVVQDILPIYRNLYMKFGTHDYGMVYDGDAHLLFYRKDLFAQYSKSYEQEFGKPLQPPQTWEEYDQIAKFLTKDMNGDGKSELYGTVTFGGDSKRYVWFAERFLAKGGRYFDDQMKPMITEKEGIESLKEWLDLLDSGATPPNAMYDWIDLNNAFLQGKVAMVVQWSDTARFSFDQKNWDSQVNGKVGWTLVPGEAKDSPRGGIWIGRVLGISSQSKHADQAWNVIQYITSPEVSQRSVTSFDTVNDPYRSSHFKSKGKGAFPSENIQQEFLRTLEQSLQNTNADLMIPGGWEYMQVLDRNIGLALIHKKTPEQALKETAEEWEKITDRYGRNKQKEYYQTWLDHLMEGRQP